MTQKATRLWLTDLECLGGSFNAAGGVGSIRYQSNERRAAVVFLCQLHQVKLTRLDVFATEALDDVLVCFVEGSVRAPAANHQ